ncbi:MAG: hypothetical protein NPIRA02_35720 [Nitrospirales bacterium]|nr:MAG: hypothetical protein NPIRA02_35720 [Nitrospirales bacterium]
MLFSCLELIWIRYNTPNSFMTVTAKPLSIGIVTALVGVLISITPFGWKIETDIGLAWLFQLRGTRPPPPEVVVVTTDRKSALDLNLPQEPWKWPRSVHGKLIQRLSEKGARVIVFDIFFQDPTDPNEDQALAQAMQEAGNVVLIEKLTTVDSSETPEDMNIHIRIQPTSQLASSAAALAPNPLPAVPFRVNQFWLFEPSQEHVPTLPFMAFNLYGLTIDDEFGNLLDQTNPLAAQHIRHWQSENPSFHTTRQTIQHLHKLFHENPPFADHLLATLAQQQSEYTIPQKTILTSLISSYHRSTSQYLDFYGPPRTITTIPYSCALDMCGLHKSQATTSEPPIDFRDKAVFVGFSEQVESEQRDRFHTVFTSPSGLYLSGVEISATAFANLFENRHITPLPLWIHLLLVALWGAIVSGILQFIPSTLYRTGTRYAIVFTATGIGAGFAYVTTAYLLFTHEALWLPLVIPLLGQLPLAMFGTIFLRYRETYRERHNMQKALEHYVPGPVANQLAKNIEEIKYSGQLLDGLCLATDAEHYTTLAETLDLQELRAFMNRYYEVVFEPVRRRDGIVSDVIGDAVLAIWTASTLDNAIRTQVCMSALEIANAVEQFNNQYKDMPLPTRIGLHGGRMWLGHVGAHDHYEYRAIGDIVNTATRIEGLNKQLGTRILASELIIKDLTTVVTRELGHFLFVGKRQPIVIHELMGRMHDCNRAHVRAIETFATALQAISRTAMGRSRTSVSRPYRNLR